MAKKSGKAARIRIKVQFGEGSLGPGKIDLLEAVAREGSISAAARAMGMNYRRAWHLLHTLEEELTAPLLVTEAGGKAKGGARLTPFARELVRLYRETETRAGQGAKGLLNLLGKKGR